MLTMSIFERESEKEIPTCVMMIILPCTSRLSHSIFKGVNDLFFCFGAKYLKTNIYIHPILSLTH